MTSDLDLDVLLFNRDFQKNEIKNALEYVENYIARNNLTLVGGMAIDYALRLKGSKIYDDDAIPDYDFISYEHYKHAYNIGNYLSTSPKYTGKVSVIRALHPITMRVRLNFCEVADITYVPQEILNRIPVLEYKGLKINHPYYQMIDQHRALSLPMENAPMETVLHRFKKDTKRHMLLWEHYPITDSNNNNNNNSKITYIKHNLSISDLDDVCITGHLGLLYWINKAVADGYLLSSNALPFYNSFEEKKGELKFQLPKKEYITLRSDDIKNALNKFNDQKDIKYFNTILDKVQQRVRFDKYEIIHNYGEKIAAYLDENNYWVSNLQGIMCYLLTFSVIYDDVLAKKSYLIAHDIWLWAIKKYNSDPDKYIKYLPTIDTFGIANIRLADVVANHTFDVMFENMDRKISYPKNAYPDNQGIPDNLYNFDYSSSIIFSIDGLETTEIHEI